MAESLILELIVVILLAISFPLLYYSIHKFYEGQIKNIILVILFSYLFLFLYKLLELYVSFTGIRTPWLEIANFLFILAIILMFLDAFLIRKFASIFSFKS